MDVSKIVDSIISTNDVSNIYYIGCGASMADLYPGVYYLRRNAKRLNTDLYTASEFIVAPPSRLGNNTVVVTCSLEGKTPETVEAAKKAAEWGCTVIALTRDGSSPLAQSAHYCIVHGFAANYAAKTEKMTHSLLLAAEFLYHCEGIGNPEAIKNGVSSVYRTIERAVTSIKKEAEKFAYSYKDAPVIYMMASGASEKVAYSNSCCLFMEMQWINSGGFHSGEFFHGPFEIVDSNVPFILLMSEGPSRKIDIRALEFLKRFGALTTVIDCKDYALASEIDNSVVEYFNPMLHTALVRVLAEHLAAARSHPLSKRRYMWKIEY